MTTILTSNTQPNLNLPIPIVHIPREVHNKIMHWVRKGGSHECSGMGKIVIKDGHPHIVDAWMVKQKNHSAESEMDGDDLARLLFQKKDIPGIMSFWWHSHAGMSTFWSTTDRDQIAKLANNGMCVATVFNNRGESRSCVAANAPFLFHVDDVKLEIVEDEINLEKIKSWDFEYTDKVQVGALINPLQTSFGDKRWDDNWDDDYYRGHSWGYLQPSATEREKVEEYNKKFTPPCTQYVAVENLDSLADTENNPKKRLQMLFRNMDCLEAAMTNQKVNRKACEILEIEFQPGLEPGSEIIGMSGRTIADEIQDMLVLIDDEIEVLKPTVKKESQNGTNKPAHLAPNRPDTA